MRVVAVILALLLATPALADTRKPAAKVPSAVAVAVEYQRVGRELLKLQDQRGFFDTGDLMPRFRAIKLDLAVATAATRVATSATLADLALKIERMRGIQLDRACLDNPLAESCS